MYDRRPLERVLRDAAAITPDLYIGDAQTIDEPYTALSLAASGEDDLLVRLTARAPRYNVRDAERLLGQLVTILLALPHAATVGAISMLDAHEREHIVRDFNRSTPFPRASTIHDLFAEAARRTPDAIAVALRDETMTYRELETAGANVAAHLHALGVRPGDFVGVCVERSFAMVAALLGILKAGAASIALDPSHPEERVAFMLGEAGAAIVLAQSHLLGALAPALARPAAARARAVVLETLLASPAPDAPAVVVTADHGAHVMYTSGSTGTPKGAVLPHRAAVRTVCGTDYLRFAPDETFFGFVPLTFDVSVLEIWGPLLCGARLVLCPPGLPALDVLAETIEAGGVTTLWLTTALFEQMIDEHVSHLRNVRRLIVGGDVMSPAHARRAMAAIPGLQLINVYGPTEATVLITAHPLRTPPTGPIPLGSPIPNAPVYILDPRGEPVPVGVPGEIYTGGPGVALGYINRPDLTAQRFVPDPFSDEPGATMYRSGDLARWRSDGAVEFLGRVDTQVKIRGVRIELGEIEGALTDHCGVREAVVVARSFGSLGLLDKALVAYVVTRTGVPAPDSAALLEHLAARLPAAMVPAKVVFLPTLPRTETGKFDRKALPDPGPLTAVRASPEHRAPRSAAEIAVASHFADVLGIDEIGLDDDFYAFGGNSLRAMRLVSRLRDTFRVDLTIRDLLTAPRVATLTARIVALGRNEGVEQRSLITTLRDSGSRAPIFFLHGDLAGGGYYCGELARVFGDDRPMYVIAPHGTESPTMPWSVEEIAAENVAAVRALSPAGPVALGGFCAGGIVAYEMARQLAGSGVAVEHVVMLDPIIADRTLRRRIASALRPLRDRFRRPRGGPNAMWVAWHEELLDRWHVILARHSPRTYAGSVSVLWSDECSTTYDRYMARWRKLAPRVTQEFIPGTHLTTITRYLGHTSRAVAAAFGHDLDAERTAAGGTKG
jgi:amino acid adenylation domain-containing protein